MEIYFEVVEFYPGKGKHPQQIGTLHVYIVDGKTQIDLRGIRVCKNQKDFYRFDIPLTSGIDPDTKKIVNFPVFAFTDSEKTEKLRKFIYSEGKKYVLQKLTEIENLEKKNNQAMLALNEKDISTQVTKSGKKGHSKNTIKSK